MLSNEIKMRVYQSLITLIMMPAAEIMAMTKIEEHKMRIAEKNI